ncbi:MAG: cytochrome c biogenesis protein ResB [Chloroflexota bacterium]
MTLSQEVKPQSPRQLLSFDYFWSLFRIPEALVLTLLALSLTLFLAALIPQQPPNLEVGVTGTEDPLDQWVTTLPTSYQSLASILTPLGLFQIFNTTWFWLPNALLLLISLITLADYGFHVRPYLQNSKKDTFVPSRHPFKTHSVEALEWVPSSETTGAVHLAEAKGQVQQTLTEKGYRVHTVGDNKFIATRFSFRWFGPILLMLGMFLGLLGIFIQVVQGEKHVFEQPLNENTPFIFGEPSLSIQVETLATERDAFGQITSGKVAVAVNGDAAQTWQLYRPTRVQGWWVVAGGIQPKARITLLPNNAARETIEPNFPNENQPAYFIYPEANVRFSLYYRDTGVPVANYELRASQEIDQETDTLEVNQDGQNFWLPQLNLAGQVTMSEHIRLRAYRLPGLIPIIAGTILVLLGLILLSFALPQTVWCTFIQHEDKLYVEFQSEQLRVLPAVEPNIASQLQIEARELNSND